MTDPARFDQVDAALPGLPGVGSDLAAAGPNETAARRTLAALVDAKLIGETHAVMCEALLTAARQLDRAAASSKAKDYGVANLLAQLREVYQVLVPTAATGGGGRSAWDQFLDDVARAGADVPGSGSAAAIRDPAES